MCAQRVVKDDEYEQLQNGSSKRRFGSGRETGMTGKQHGSSSSAQ